MYTRVNRKNCFMIITCIMNVRSFSFLVVCSEKKNFTLRLLHNYHCGLKANKNSDGTLL